MAGKKMDGGGGGGEEMEAKEGVHFCHVCVLENGSCREIIIALPLHTMCIQMCSRILSTKCTSYTRKHYRYNVPTCTLYMYFLHREGRDGAGMVCTK